MYYLNDLFAISALGITEDEFLLNLKSNNTNLLKETSGFLHNNMSAPLGIINAIETQGNQKRNICLLQYVLKHLKESLDNALNKYPKDRIGVVIGTSTSLISDVERNLTTKSNDELDANNTNETIPNQLYKFDANVYEIGDISTEISKLLGVLGPSYTIATACSSAARALMSARALIDSNICDCVVVGGTDSMSQVTVSGFHALGALSLEKAVPFKNTRNGINIGEGAGLTVMSKDILSHNHIKLLGMGGSSDAYHPSAPDPSGIMGCIATCKALNDANLKAQDIGYINMHGTGTKLNDAMEGQIVRKVFKDLNVPVSSTKHLTGHTLGAAAIVEAYICALILRYDLNLPYHAYEFDDVKDEFGDINLVLRDNVKLKSKVIMSNSFAFGGNNASLIFGI